MKNNINTIKSRLEHAFDTWNKLSPDKKLIFKDPKLNLQILVELMEQKEIFLEGDDLKINIIVSTIKNHFFVDGNKRFALILVYYMYNNSYQSKECDIDCKEISSFIFEKIIDIAKSEGNCTIEEEDKKLLEKINKLSYKDLEELFYKFKVYDSEK